MWIMEILIVVGIFYDLSLRDPGVKKCQAGRTESVQDSFYR